MIGGIQKIQRERIRDIQGKIGTPSKIKRQRVKQITGKDDVKIKKLPPIKL